MAHFQYLKHLPLIRRGALTYRIRPPPHNTLLQHHGPHMARHHFPHARRATKLAGRVAGSRSSGGDAKSRGMDRRRTETRSQAA